MFIHSIHEKEYREFVRQLRPLRQRKEIGQSLNEFNMNEDIYRKLLAFAYAFTGVENFLKQRSKKLFKINVRNTKRPPLEFHPLRMDFEKLSLQEISLLDLITYFLKQSTAVDTALAYPYPFYRLAYLDEREFTLFAYAWRLAAGHEDMTPIDFRMSIPGRDTLWNKLFEESAKELETAKEALEDQIRNKTEYKDGVLVRPNKDYQVTLAPDMVRRILQAATYLRYHQNPNLNRWADYLLTKFPFTLEYEKLERNTLKAGIASFNEIPKLLMSLNEAEFPVVMQTLAHIFQIPIEDDVLIVDTSTSGV